MRYLTRTEEFVLLAVWRLQDDAYSVRISEHLQEVTGEEWSLSSVYMPLKRLRKRGLCETHLSDSTPERGGRPKRMYRLTDSGIRALVEVRQVARDVWADIPDFSLSGAR